MSFLGSIGHLMAGSGLKELLELIYAPNAVQHMLSGKSVSRALRGHFIIHSAPNALLYSIALGGTIPHLQTAGMNDPCYNYLQISLIISIMVIGF